MLMLEIAVAAAIGLAPLADVRIGEEDRQTRIEVLCSQTCQAEPLSENTYLISGASGDFRADVSDRSSFVRQIKMETRRFGAAMTISANRPARSVTVARCGPARLCFDFDFSAPRPVQPQPTLASLDAQLIQLARRSGLANAAPVRLAAASQNAARCGEAEQALAEDAWNLLAYRTVSLCRASGAGSADGRRYVSRLQEFSDRSLVVGGVQAASGVQSALR